MYYGVFKKEKLFLFECWDYFIMPQLDKLSFHSQHFWLTIFSIVIFSLIVLYFMPNCFTSMSLRHKIASSAVISTIKVNIQLLNFFCSNRFSAFLRKKNI